MTSRAAYRYPSFPLNSEARPPRFVKNELALLALRERLHLCYCPHCGKTGFLIGHGGLSGYSESSGETVQRGARFYCSNRYRKLGCGRTFSVLFAGFLARFTVTTLSLWSLFRKATSSSVYAAARAFSLSRSSAYRLFRRLCERVPWLRSQCSLVTPPPLSTASALAQLAEHIAIAFCAGCPLSSLQEASQSLLLP